MIRFWRNWWISVWKMTLKDMRRVFKSWRWWLPIKVFSTDSSEQCRLLTETETRDHLRLLLKCTPPWTLECLKRTRWSRQGLRECCNSTRIMCLTDSLGTSTPLRKSSSKSSLTSGRTSTETWWQLMRTTQDASISLILTSSVSSSRFPSRKKSLEELLRVSLSTRIVMILTMTTTE